MRSVTTIWPRVGPIGAARPTIGASVWLALPAASTTLPARISPCRLESRNSPPLRAIAETGRSGQIVDAEQLQPGVEGAEGAQ